MYTIILFQFFVQKKYFIIKRSC